MLHFHTLTDASAAKAYYRSPDFAIEGQAPRAYWLGQGAALLGLSGPLVDYQQFERLVDNYHPFEPARKLTAARRPDRDFARDMTVSVMKSASIAATVGEDERVVLAAEKALAVMFEVMEKHAETRVRKNGADFNRVSGNLVACVFPHTTSRPVNGEPDPQLHWHVVILNLTYDPLEGQWKAVQFKNLIKDSQYYHQIFRGEFARQLLATGYEVKPTKDAFELHGIPPRAVKEFSRRTAQVEEKAKARGITSKERKAYIAPMTREKKVKGMGWRELLARWKRRLMPEELKAVLHTVANAVTPWVVFDRTKEAVQEALDSACKPGCQVDERKLATEAMKRGLSGTTADAVHAELAERDDVEREERGGRWFVCRKQAEEPKERSKPRSRMRRYLGWMRDSREAERTHEQDRGSHDRD